MGGTLPIGVRQFKIIFIQCLIAYNHTKTNTIFSSNDIEILQNSFRKETKFWNIAGNIFKLNARACTTNSYRFNYSKKSHKSSSP